MHNNGNKKKAFTLAEVMIVLLVLTILFAAVAPLITKKRRATTNEDLWSWQTRGFSSQTHAKKANDNGSVFFGVTPLNAGDAVDLADSSKVIIRSGLLSDNNIQRQIQLRYGDDEKQPYGRIGTIGATLLADNTNLLLGSTFPSLDKYFNLARYPKNNIAIGYNALNNLSSNSVDNPASNNVAVGYAALGRINTNSNNNVAVGANAGATLSSGGSGNVFLGADADADNAAISNNTLIGNNAKSKGVNNVIIGSRSDDATALPANNTSIGYNALKSLDNGTYNIAVGFGALENLKNGSRNVALGYKACANLEYSSNKTCIGANSGPRTLDDDNNHIASAKGTEAAPDESIRTYIGSFDNGYYGGGDAPLEIHNMEYSTASYLANNPKVKSNTTTVVNGNLIVRGNMFLTYGNYLYPFTFNGASSNIFGVKSTQLSSPCNRDQHSYNFGSCSINLSSDRRLKYIGSRFNGGLDEINKLQVYNYTFKKDPKNEPHTGVIAQQLQKVFPSAVSKGEDGYLRIRWDEMFYACINAIKTLNQRVASLVKRTLTLENEVNKLEKENSQLKAEVDNISARVEKLKSLRK